MDAAREAKLIKTVEALENARRTGITLEELPEAMRPADLVEAAWVQDALSAVYGPAGGYKIGAAAPDATPSFCAMPAAWIAGDGATLAARRYRGLEAEIAFLVGEDLPPRDLPYTRDEVLDAMESCHPAIEELESAFRDPAGVADRLSVLADLQMHGGFVYGPAVEGWRRIDFTRERVMLAVDGVVRVERTGSNTSGDLLRLPVYLANEGATRTGGLRRGQWITTGSWTGNTLASASSTVSARFEQAGEVHLSFAAS